MSRGALTRPDEVLFQWPPDTGAPGVMAVIAPPAEPLPVGPREMVAPTVDVRERAAFLVEALDLLAEHSKLGGLIKAPHTSARADLESRYGPLHPDSGTGIIDEAALKRRAVLQGARSKLKAAYELGMGPVENDDPGLIIGFGQFNRKFAGARGRKARDRRRNNLQALAAMEGEARGGDGYTVEPEFVAEPASTDQPELVETRQGTRPSNADKLQRLLRDDRAGFLPATNHEKSQALALLEYMDNPEHRAGIGNWLQKVYRHQERVHGSDAGTEALVSIAFEFGDHYEQAADQAEALRELRQAVQGCPEPDRTLAEAIGSVHPGYAPLVRYLDVLSVAIGADGYLPARYDPLRTREDREGPQGYAAKNKTLLDQYSADEPSEEAQRRITRQVETLTANEIRRVVDEALQNEERRAGFWEERLRETRAHGAAWRAGRLILERHELPLWPPRHTAA